MVSALEIVILQSFFYLFIVILPNLKFEGSFPGMHNLQVTPFEIVRSIRKFF
jgi:hypothetical protein